MAITAEYPNTETVDVGELKLDCFWIEDLDMLLSFEFRIHITDYSPNPYTWTIISLQIDDDIGEAQPLLETSLNCRHLAEAYSEHIVQLSEFLDYDLDELSSDNFFDTYIFDIVDRTLAVWIGQYREEGMADAEFDLVAHHYSKNLSEYLENT